MRRLLGVVVGMSLVLRALGAEPPVAGLPLAPDTRVMVVAPHPDDETIAAGGVLAYAAARRMPVRVVFVTNGDGYVEVVGGTRGTASDADFKAYGLRRRQEALAATARLGLARTDVAFLGFPDGGLDQLWHAHWARPYTSPFTREGGPPYPDAVDPEATYAGKDLTAILVKVIGEFRPTVLILPHPADTHLDHAAAAAFIIEAVTRLQMRRMLDISPLLLGYLVHYPGWPAVRAPNLQHVHPASTITARWLGKDVDARSATAKEAALVAYETQLAVMRGFLRGFLRSNELFAVIDARMRDRIAAVH